MTMLLFLKWLEFLGLTRDVLLFAVYIPPQGSPYHERSKLNDGVSLLEQSILETVVEFTLNCYINILHKYDNSCTMW